MYRNFDYNSDQPATDGTPATISSQSSALTLPAVEPKAIDFDAWRVLLRSVRGRSEPESGLCERGQTQANRLFVQLVQDAANEYGQACASATPYMQLAIYDLLGAMFAVPDLPAVSPHTDKLFKRICNVIRDRFADPNFGPRQVADEVGISLRYVQKLFTVRSSSCTHFILSVRLDHAARLLHRRTVLNMREPICQIAYASGFNDYTHFARQFRRRFGHPPGAHGKGSSASEVAPTTAPLPSRGA